MQNLREAVIKLSNHVTSDITIDMIVNSPSNVNRLLIGASVEGMMEFLIVVIIFLISVIIGLLIAISGRLDAILAFLEKVERGR